MDPHFYFFVYYQFFLFPAIFLRVTFTAIWEETFKHFLDENTMKTLLFIQTLIYILNVYIILHHTFYWVKIDDRINSSTY